MTPYCWAEERILYKSIMPNGQVVYGDEPEAKAKLRILANVTDDSGPS